MLDATSRRQPTRNRDSSAIAWPLDFFSIRAPSFPAPSMHTLFLLCEAPDLAFDAATVAKLADAVGRLPRLDSARLMVPDLTAADQPFAKDGPGPALAMQLYFRERGDLDAAAPAIAGLARHESLASVPAESLSWQATEARLFPVGAGEPAEPCCTFLVTYPGTTDDLPAWLAHYDAYHPPIMVRFPRIREVETYHPAAALDLPWRQSNAMQRNKVVFDSLADLVAALASPVMAEMFADGRKFPPFVGKATHYPMTARRVNGRG